MPISLLLFSCAVAPVRNPVDYTRIYAPLDSDSKAVLHELALTLAYDKYGRDRPAKPEPINPQRPAIHGQQPPEPIPSLTPEGLLSYEVPQYTEDGGHIPQPTSLRVTSICSHQTVRWTIPISGRHILADLTVPNELQAKQNLCDPSEVHLDFLAPSPFNHRIVDGTVILLIHESSKWREPTPIESELMIIMEVSTFYSLKELRTIVNTELHKRK